MRKFNRRKQKTNSFIDILEDWNREPYQTRSSLQENRKTQLPYLKEIIQDLDKFRASEDNLRIRSEVKNEKVARFIRIFSEVQRMLE